MAKRTSAPILEVHLLREGIVESVHQVEAAVYDQRGRLLAVAGNAETCAFMRSALKPFQALAVTTTGTLAHYNLSDKDLAIICSSHQGTTSQARQVFSILWQADIEPTALQCPIPEGKKSPLEYNCSGKHAGMLAVSQKYGWPLKNYLSRSHPVQQLILAQISELLKMPGDEFITAHDDCGAPIYLMQLGQMAYLYAQLASGNNLDLERIVRAMTQYPYLIGGKGHFDSELMDITNGQLVSKAGAEGVQCIGKVGEGMGLALKVKDGSKRAKYAVAIHLLRELGWLNPSLADSLAEQFMILSKYKRLEVIGTLSMV